MLISISHWNVSRARWIQSVHTWRYVKLTIEVFASTCRMREMVAVGHSVNAISGRNTETHSAARFVAALCGRTRWSPLLQPNKNSIGPCTKWIKRVLLEIILYRLLFTIWRSICGKRHRNLVDKTKSCHCSRMWIVSVGQWPKSKASSCVSHLTHATGLQGRAIAQADSRWLPTAAARVRARVWSSRICCGQSGAEAGFLRVLRFPLPIFIPPISPS
jgi:hypothetical protein